MTNSPEARTSTGEILDQSTTSTEAPKPEAPAGAPETYDFKAPDGVELDPSTIAEATPLFKELNLTQDQAQKLVDLYTKQTSGIRETAMKAVEKMRSDWVAEIRSDKEIGGILESKVLPEIGKLKALLPPAVREGFESGMNFTGAGDHPGILKALYHFAQRVNEGGHVSGGKPSPHGQSNSGQASRPTLAGALYPNLPQ